MQYIRTNTSTYINTNKCVHVRAHVRVRVRLLLCACACMCVCVCLRVCVCFIENSLLRVTFLIHTHILADALDKTNRKYMSRIYLYIYVSYTCKKI